MLYYRSAPVVASISTTLRVVVPGAQQWDECSNNRERGLVKGCANRGRLLTFYRFPGAQWKALRTPNAIERLHPVKSSVIFASP